MVTIPVGVCKIAESDRRKVERAGPSGEPLSQRLFDSATGLEVQDEDIQYGIKTADGFRSVPSRELEIIKERTQLSGIEIVEFIDYQNIPFERVEGAYFLQAKGNLRGARHFVEAMLSEQTAAVAKWTARSRQSLVTIYPSDEGAIIMNKLVFKDQWKQPDTDVLKHMSEPIDDMLLEKAIELVNNSLSRSGESLDNLQDDAIVLTLDLISKALDGEPMEGELESHHHSDPNADLLAALNMSLEAEQTTRKKRGKRVSNKDRK